MEAWVCMRCRTANPDAARSCIGCDSAPDFDQPVAAALAFPGVEVVRDVRDDSVAAALTGPVGRAGAADEPVLQPFFQLERAPRHPRLRRATRLWPLAVFLVVLLFFAIAGLAR